LLRIVLNASQILRVGAAFLAMSLTAFAQSSEPKSGGIPPVDREFRGLWVATVGNSDWPSKPGLTTREQKQELLNIMDRAVGLNMNVIVLQVRPSCDALYDSQIEPWSEYLTGKMGQAPRPYYDPLEFAVKEAHKRGLELHAWFNPFRARLRDSKSPTPRNHVVYTHPALVRSYGKYLWLDPTEQATRDYSLRVIMDVVHRYDIDGVHFDDYFYPYKETAPNSKVEMDFPDGASWARYQKSGGRLSRNDWRRENVTLFVRSVYDSIKKEKPWVKFGISPFGIWQPKYPAQIEGLNSYDVLFCDSRKWLENGWVDYLAPQLYWPIAQKAQSFPVLLNWWAEQNPRHRLLITGMKVDGWKHVDDDAREETSEVIATRRQPGASGEILWHSKPLFANHGGIADALRRTAYSKPALVPACPWLETASPGRPVLTVKQNRHGLKLSWKESMGDAWQWVVRKRMGKHWTTEILPCDQTKEAVSIEDYGVLPDFVAINAVSRCGDMSDPAVFNTGHGTE
jgi:uncharacterized lipoprotein YddW (UPF0748 family)